MSAEHNLKIVTNTYAAFGRGDIPGLLEHLSDDVTWGIEAANVDVPWFAQIKGKKNVPAFFEALGKEVDFHKFEPHDFAATHDQIYCTIRLEATFKSTGKRIASRDVHRFTFKDGKVVDWRAWVDTALVRDAHKG